MGALQTKEGRHPTLLNVYAYLCSFLPDSQRTCWYEEVNCHKSEFLLQKFKILPILLRDRFFSADNGDLPHEGGVLTQLQFSLISR